VSPIHDSDDHDPVTFSSGDVDGIASAAALVRTSLARRRAGQGTARHAHQRQSLGHRVIRAFLRTVALLNVYAAQEERR
jgi:hypothetical protein